MSQPSFEERPWGTFEVLGKFSVEDASSGSVDVVVKKITVAPNKRLSYQSHQGRKEQWYIVSGSGLVTHEGKEQKIKTDDSITIQKTEKHRIANIGSSPLIFVEVATGSVDENDITRFEDDFGRVNL